MPVTPFFTRASGKLLLSAEYVVLDGALALAAPTRFGQTLEVQAGENDAILHWHSLNEKDEIWFDAEFTLPELHIRHSTHEKTAETLQSILKAIRRQQPDFLNDTAGIEVSTRTDFPRAWGLGTSSTLIAALCAWGNANPYTVLSETMGGSGYDLACAYAPGALLYQLENGKPRSTPVDFHPPFAEQLYFVYTGQKQDSREGIQRYRQQKPSAGLIDAISEITRGLLEAADIDTFENLLEEHEALISAQLNMPRAAETLFPAYPGVVKSLGAWGGDFVLVSSLWDKDITVGWFREHGFGTILSWTAMLR